DEAVRVPGLVAAQVDLDHRHAQFHKAAGEQAGPAEQVAAISVEHLRRFALEIESGADLRRGQERQGARVLLIESGNLGRLVEPGIDGLKPTGAWLRPVSMM